ncbi:MAG: ABC transporter ATP-binding protein [Candidatus Competibacteraceae bacterium]|nr:ABC transporter ATP-binding protein [Candidatus Competibacteraceae bacterium]
MTTTGLRVNHLRKTFQGGSVVACQDVNLDIEQGELLVLLGPSGCGKTTTLRCIAGLERPDNNDAIWLNGTNITRVPPKDRNLAFVFQDTALFPHLNVRRNISFGLDMRKALPQDDIKRRVDEVGKLLQVGHLLERSAHELSGGQGQRVALGRAIVMEPAAFLLDEPLANLDAALRVEMRTEIKLIQRKLDTTMIFVTHDQEEALTLGDKIAVMKDGLVQQVDSARNIYLRPANLFVGTFIGSPPINQFPCTLKAEGDTLMLCSPSFTLPLPPAIAKALTDKNCTALTLGIRPEFIQIAESGAAAGTISGSVQLTELLGSRTLIYVTVGDTEYRVLVQGDSAIKEGDNVHLSVQLDKAFYFDQNGNNALSATG